MAANINRPVVGQVACYTRDCTETATVHQIAKGSRTGEYYLRCPVCKCNQSSGPHMQNYIKANMQARPGHEINQAEIQAAINQSIQGDEPIGQEPEQVEPIGQNSEPERKMGGLLAGLLAAGAIISIIAGVKTK